MARAYDITTETLTSDSPRAPQPDDCLVTLRPHQLALLHRAQQFEDGSVKLSNDDYSQITTSVAVLGDSVGSGKSYVVLAMVAADRLDSRAAGSVRPKTCVMAGARVVATRSGTPDCARCTVLVIPHNLCAQWDGYVRAFSQSMRYVLLARSKQVATFDVGAQHDLIIVTSTFYNQLARRFAAERVKVKRVVFDEADSINVPSCMEIAAAFTWFVTASYGNLLYPAGYTYHDPRTGEHICMATGLQGSGFIRGVFSDFSDKRISRMLVLRNAEAFIAESVMLPDMNVRVVACRTPASIHMLHGYVEREVIDMLNAGDVQGAMSALDPSKRATQDNVVAACISNYQHSLDHLRQQLPAYENIRSVCAAAEEARWSNEIERLRRRISEHEERINGIRRRITESALCAICLDGVRDKTVVPCCAVAYCFECLMRCIAVTQSCPTCRRGLTANDVMVVSRDAPSERDCDEQRMDKLQHLLKIVEGGAADSKFLVFSSFDTSFSSVARSLTMRGVTHAHLRGNAAQVSSTVTAYRGGALRVLLVNGRSYGSGLDLSVTTDVVLFHKLDNEIERQVIGRAQRGGRTAPLNLWYLLHANEIRDA